MQNLSRRTKESTRQGVSEHAVRAPGRAGRRAREAEAEAEAEAAEAAEADYLGLKP